MPVFVAISRRILLDFSSNRQGFPDLLLWNPKESKVRLTMIREEPKVPYGSARSIQFHLVLQCLFVEVKGSKDTLSSSQAMWLDFLRQNGAQVNLAVVRA